MSKAEAERVALLRSIEEEHAINTRLKAQGEESQRKDKEELKAMDAEVTIDKLSMPLWGKVLKKSDFTDGVCVHRSSARVTGSRGRSRHSSRPNRRRWPARRRTSRRCKMTWVSVNRLAG